MKADIKAGYEQNRVTLADKLPLSTPFTLYISASQLCNFKCFYCTQSWSNQEKQKIDFTHKNLEWDNFLKIMDQSQQFPEKYKLILFTGLGEPFLHTRLPEMVSEITKRNITEKIEINTNATFLNKDMAMRLKNTGLTRIRVSIQGINQERYKKYCNVDIDFAKLIEDIKDFYENKGDIKLYIKIIDQCMEQGDQEQFYKLFGNICDEIYVEHLSTLQSTMNYEGIDIDNTKTLFGEELVNPDVCQLLFYILQIDVDGNVYPCCPLGLPAQFSQGNIFKEDISLYKIWNSKSLNDIRLAHLSGERASQAVCGGCNGFQPNYRKSDDLDPYKEVLLKRFKEISNE